MIRFASRRSSSLRPFLAAFALGIAALASDVSAHADTPSTAAPSATIATGRYVLKLHATKIRGVAVNPRTWKSFPVVIAAQGSRIAMGGRNAPQLTGTLQGSKFSLRPAPGSPNVSLDGTLSPQGASQGTFSFKTGKGMDVSGTFTVSAFSGNIHTPTGQSIGTYTNGSGAIGNASYGSGRNTVPGVTAGQTGAPGTANNGPNLGGTSVSGANQDGKDGSKSWFSSFVDSLDWGSGKGGGGGSSSDTKSSSSSSTSSDDKGFFSGLWDEAKTEWNETFGDDDSSKKGNGNTSVDERETYGGGTQKLNGGRTGGGQDKGGGSTDRGAAAGGGQNAQGQSIAKKPNAGDNPFEVTKGDVLNVNHFVDPAKDPVFGPGGMNLQGSTMKH